MYIQDAHLNTVTTMEAAMKLPRRYTVVITKTVKKLAKIYFFGPFLCM